MILISHRGNLEGPQSALENSPGYINLALEAGYNVEIDVWADDSNKLFLGHDQGIYPIDIGYLVNSKFWCHAKNKKALDLMLGNSMIHCFWHEQDKYTLTSKNFIWTFPGGILSSFSICVMPELFPDLKIGKCAGICSDHIVKSFR